MMSCTFIQELGLPFIKLAATEVVSGVSGESEATLRDLFQLAKVSSLISCACMYTNLTWT